MGSSKSVMSHDPLAGGATADTATGAAERDTVVLPSSLTIAEVGDVKRRFMTGIQDTGRLTIDCEALDVIDGAGLQLLAAVAGFAAERAVTLDWRSPPAMLGEQLALIGLGPIVELA
jgi:anti-anti-sigma regulatory factor